MRLRLFTNSKYSIEPALNRISEVMKIRAKTILDLKIFSALSEL